MTAPIRPRSGSPTLGRLLVIDGVNYTALAWAVLALAVSILVYRVFGFKYGFPEAISSRIDFIYWINIGEDWLKANVRDATRAIAKVITYWIGEVEYFLQVRPWPLVVVALGLLGLRFGGLRLAPLTVVGVMFWGAVDMWDPAMSTLSLMGVSVVISVGWASRSGSGVHRTTGLSPPSGLCSTPCRPCRPSSIYCRRSFCSVSATPGRRWRSSSTPCRRWCV